MANVNLNIETKGGQQATKTLGQLESRAEQLNKELKDVNQGSARFRELQTELRKTNSEIKNIEESTEGLSFEDKGRAIGDVAGGLTQSFGALQTVLASSDGQLQEVIATSVKYIQIGEGVKGGIEAITASQKLFTKSLGRSRVALTAYAAAQRTFRFVTQASNVALRVTRGILVSMGIGAVTVALGYLITNFDKVKSAVKTAGNWLAQFIPDFLLARVKSFFGAIEDGLQTLGVMSEETEKNTNKQKQNNRERKEANKLIKEVDKALNNENLSLEENRKLQQEIKLKLADANLKYAERIRLLEKLEKLQKDEKQTKAEKELEKLKKQREIAENRGEDTFREQVAILVQKRKMAETDRERKVIQSEINELYRERDEEERTEELKEQKDALQAQAISEKNKNGESLEYLALQSKIAGKEKKLADSKSEQARAQVKQNNAQDKFNQKLEKQAKLAMMALSGNFMPGAVSGGDDNAGGSSAGSDSGNNNNNDDDKKTSYLGQLLGTSDKQINKYKSVATDTANFISNIGDKRRKRELDAEMRKLQKQRKQELANENLTQAEKERINRKYDKREKKLRKKQFKNRKKNDKQEALMNGSIAITKALAATAGNPVQFAIRAALITAKTAAQVSAINSRKFKGKQGGVLQGPSHENGGIKGKGRFNNVEVEGGEYVINRKSTEQYKPILDKINQGKFRAGGQLPGNNGNEEITAEIRKLRQENQEQNRTLKAYVVENEITNEQQKQQRIRKKANLN